MHRETCHFIDFLIHCFYFIDRDIFKPSTIMIHKEIEDIPFEEVNEIQKYGSYFDDNSFWKKVKKIAKKVGATVIRPVLTLYYLLQDENVSTQHKAYIIGALGYFILPFDIIPEALLSIVGFTDDVAVMTFVLKMVHNSITPEIKRKVDQKIMELFSDPA